MPYRAYHLVLGIAGAVTVLALMLVIGRGNLDHHARTGPRWKRRLVNAGLLLLAAVGFGPAAGAGCEGPDPTKSGYTYPSGDGRRGRRRSTLRSEKRRVRRPDPPRPTPPQPHGEKRVDRTAAAGIYKSPPRPAAPDPPPTPQPAATAVRLAAPFTLITKSHDEATAIASGSKGRYPFDKAGKERVLRELLEAQASCDVLRKAGQMTAPEAALMKQRLARLGTAVNGFRHTGYIASCYSPRPRKPPAELSLSRLTSRLPFLQRLATTRRLHHDVVKKILAAVTADLKVLEDKQQRGELRTVVDRARAARLAKQVRRQVDRVHKQLRRPPKVRPGVARSPQWKVFEKAWAHVNPLTDRSRRTTTAEHRKARAWLKSARQATGDLVTAKLLTADESQLLRVELARLGMLLRRNRPTDSRARCYRPAPFRPRRNSKERLEQRRALLLKIAKRGRISKAVRDRIMPSMTRDLALLAELPRKDSLASLLRQQKDKPPEPKVVDPFVKKMRALLARVKRLPTRK